MRFWLKFDPLFYLFGDFSRDFFGKCVKLTLKCSGKCVNNVLKVLGKCEISLKIVKINDIIMLVIKMRLKREIDDYLINWKMDKNRLPLIIKGARQIGKTNAIEYFGKNNYKNFVEINFIEQPEYVDIFDNGYSVDNIIKNITLKDPSINIIPHETLIFFDEIQKCPNAATALKFFKLDNRYDVICSGSLMGINYQEIESNSVGYKTDYIMYSLDFEEFLWAKGYKNEQIEDLYDCMINLKPLTQIQYDVMLNNFQEYMIVGGMPAIVTRFIENNNYSGILDMQKQILLDYEEDITKYAGNLDKAKILNAYRKIKVFLGNENKKFQITKLASGARNRDYIGVIDWLSNAGIVNISYCLDNIALPLRANYNPNNYRLYYADTALLIGSLDKETQDDLRLNKNFNTYKGAIYENVIAEELVKYGFDLFFYKKDKPSIEIDFIIRDIDSIIPIEIKASNNATPSLIKVMESNYYPDIKYGIKLCNKNIGFNGKFYTFPYFLTFLLKRFLDEMNKLM